MSYIFEIHCAFRSSPGATSTISIHLQGMRCLQPPCLCVGRCLSSWAAACLQLQPCLPLAIFPTSSHHHLLQRHHPSPRGKTRHQPLCALAANRTRQRATRYFWGCAKRREAARISELIASHRPSNPSASCIRIASASHAPFRRTGLRQGAGGQGRIEARYESFQLLLAVSAQAPSCTSISRNVTG